MEDVAGEIFRHLMDSDTLTVAAGFVAGRWHAAFEHGAEAGEVVLPKDWYEAVF
ncbi:hypothetical protein D3C72_2225100 [compost metagenome]